MVGVVGVVLPLLWLSRPNPERLPRNCGLIKAAEFSAAVVPLSRRVRSSGADVTVAVRVAITTGPAVCSTDRER
jgi:hypothetical protein